MCYNYSIAATAEEIAGRYNISQKPGAINPYPIYHAIGFAFPALPVIFQEYKSTNLKLELMQWGIVPGWVKGEENALDIRGKTLNARAESIHAKPSFRSAFQYRPCLVPATGYFEWMHHEGKKYPFFLHLKESPLFSFAGIWEEWANKQTGEILRSFSIITCEANSLTGKIHNTKNRMPVILDQESENDWFDHSIRTSRQNQLLKPYDAAKMNAFSISRLITARDRDSNVPEVIKPVIYPELPDLLL
jgi:putative SOS response-associated peptidase YedK